MSTGLALTVAISVVFVALYIFFNKIRQKKAPPKNINAIGAREEIAELGKTGYANIEQIVGDAQDMNEKGKAVIPQIVTEPVLCRVTDCDKSTVENVELSPDVINEVLHKYGTLGRRRNRDGKNVYGLNRLKTGEYAPIITSRDMKHSPIGLHNKIQLPRMAVPVVYDMKEEKAFMEKYGQLLVWGAVMAFIGFLYMTGGG